VQRGAPRKVRELTSVVELLIGQCRNGRMNLVSVMFYEIAWYGPWWICFVAIAYFSARYLGWPGVIGGAFVVFLVVIPIDVAWIFDDMRYHPEHGRDADFAFWSGVLFRTVLFNIVLLPVSLIGWKLRACGRRAPIEMNIGSGTHRRG
jgi:hypothetical protein